MPSWGGSHLKDSVTEKRPGENSVWRCKACESRATPALVSRASKLHSAHTHTHTRMHTRTRTHSACIMPGHTHVHTHTHGLYWAGGLPTAHTGDKSLGPGIYFVRAKAHRCLDNRSGEWEVLEGGAGRSLFRSLILKGLRTSQGSWHRRSLNLIASPFLSPKP